MQTKTVEFEGHCKTHGGFVTMTGQPQSCPRCWERETYVELPSRTNSIGLRDYFAANAMVAITQRINERATFKNVAEDAYNQADAMLAAREVK